MPTDRAIGTEHSSLLSAAIVRPAIVVPRVAISAILLGAMPGDTAQIGVSSNSSQESIAIIRNRLSGSPGRSRDFCVNGATILL
jgi:hypothetical protein